MPSAETSEKPGSGAVLAALPPIGGATINVETSKMDKKSYVFAFANARFVH